MTRTGREPRLPASLPDELLVGRPKGAQLREILEGLVRTLPKGELLPSERVLAGRFGVARMTVRQEVDRLVAEGLVVRRHGHGTFVAGPRLVPSDPVVCFADDMRARGMEPCARMLSADIVRPTAYVAGRLDIEAKAPVVEVVRVRTADGEPMALEWSKLPAERFPGLREVDFGVNSLWGELRRRWQVRVERTEDRISVVLPRPEEAAVLGVSPAQPCFAIEGVVTDGDGVPVEHCLALYRGDRYDVRRRAHVG